MSDELQKAIDAVVDGTPGAGSAAGREVRDVEAAAGAILRATVQAEAPPARLRDKLRQDAARFSAGDNVVPFPKTEPLGAAESTPWFPMRAWGWQMAAALTLLLAVWGWSQPRGGQPAPVEQQRAGLLRGAVDLAQADFAPGFDRYAGLGGDVVWSTRGQEGFLRLKGVPANNPSVAQYQLWIVDPERDEFPVDGGVFDIPPGGGETVVRFTPRLPVSRPAAFVITREQPGGVVKSRNAKPVAIAKL
jgi:hypothetical protein